MSDLGRLFRLSLAGPKPLENFTTVALAIAIGHDDRPMKEALRRVDCTCQGSDAHPVLAMCRTVAGDQLTVTAETQKTLRPEDDATRGYLDLVLTIRDQAQRDSSIWVEVKVDAWESGDQLDVYRRHAARISSSPAIITLGRWQVSPNVPFLKWSDIVDAIAMVPDPHYAWVSLREFLLDEKIARPPIPPDSVCADTCINILLDINRRVRAHWPNTGTALAWRDGDLLRALKRSAADREFSTVGGPLVYGLMPVGARWEWRLIVSTRNYARIPLDAQQMLRDAEVRALPEDWTRHKDRSYVFERRLAWGTLTSHEEVVSWFDEGLRQLREAKILDRYLAAIAK